MPGPQVEEEFYIETDTIDSDLLRDDDEVRQGDYIPSEQRNAETPTAHYKGPKPGDPKAHPNLSFPDVASFTRIILSVNRSGAKDAAGLTTKATSAIIRQSTKFRDHFYKLCRIACYVGYVPECFKNDIIVFLYKRKGDMLDPSNYRPITHAAAYGKHLEKFLLHATKTEPDLNAENHAYTEKHSIFSAITELIGTVDDFHRLNHTIISRPQRRHFKIIPIILAEDISGAFESFDHKSVTYNNSTTSHQHKENQSK